MDTAAVIALLAGSSLLGPIHADSSPTTVVCDYRRTIDNRTGEAVQAGGSVSFRLAFSDFGTVRIESSDYMCPLFHGTVTEQSIVGECVYLLDGVHIEMLLQIDRSTGAMVLSSAPDGRPGTLIELGECRLTGAGESGQ